MSEALEQHRVLADIYTALVSDLSTMRVGLIGHFQPCITEIYLHI